MRVLFSRMLSLVIGLLGSIVIIAIFNFFRINNMLKVLRKVFFFASGVSVTFSRRVLS